LYELDSLSALQKQNTNKIKKINKIKNKKNSHRCVLDRSPQARTETEDFMKLWIVLACWPSCPSTQRWLFFYFLFYLFFLFCLCFVFAMQTRSRVHTSVCANFFHSSPLNTLLLGCVCHIRYGVDNVLVRIADPVWLGHCDEHKIDASNKTCRKVCFFFVDLLHENERYNQEKAGKLFIDKQAGLPTCLSTCDKLGNEIHWLTFVGMLHVFQQKPIHICFSLPGLKY